MGFHITGEPESDAVLDDSPFAILLGMMLDQQYPMEHAFRGPAKVLDRFGTLDPARIAEADPEEFAALCATPPAIHPFRDRWHRGCRSWPAVLDQYDGDTARRGPRRVRPGLVGGGGAAGLRQAEGADLCRPAGQAARHPP